MTPASKLGRRGESFYSIYICFLCVKPCLFLVFVFECERLFHHVSSFQLEPCDLQTQALGHVILATRINSIGFHSKFVPRCGETMTSIWGHFAFMIGNWKLNIFLRVSRSIVLCHPSEPKFAQLYKLVPRVQVQRLVQVPTTEVVRSGNRSPGVAMILDIGA